MDSSPESPRSVSSSRIVPKPSAVPRIAPRRSNAGGPLGAPHPRGRSSPAQSTLRRRCGARARASVWHPISARQPLFHRPPRQAGAGLLVDIAHVCGTRGWARCNMTIPQARRQVHLIPPGNYASVMHPRCSTLRVGPRYRPHGLRRHGTLRIRRRGLAPPTCRALCLNYIAASRSSFAAGAVHG
jgi:hypothetical protein